MEGIVMNAYRVGPIEYHQIGRAYLLVQPVARGLDIRAWRRFCLGVLNLRLPAADDAEGVVVAVNSLADVKGLAIVAVKNHPLHGRVLNVPIFVTASAADDEGVAAELLSALRDRAVSGRCEGLFIWNLTDDSWQRRLRETAFERSDQGIFMPLEA